MLNENARSGNVYPDNHDDVRSRIAGEKYFTLRPKPLEQWLWKQRLPPAAERVFWLHWSEGARNRDWCSQIGIHAVARECHVDASTVTRAYQQLKRLGLLRRTDPGRDANNPFEQATAVTEVLLPIELVRQLSAFPNRTRRTTETPAPRPATPAPATVTTRTIEKSAVTIEGRQAWRQADQAARQAMSEAEKERHAEAFFKGLPRIDFDPETRLNSDQQIHLLSVLAAKAQAQVKAAPPAPMSVNAASNRGPRRLSVFDLARLRRQVQKHTPADRADDLTRQILWAVEEGALTKFAGGKAVNIALKKLREGLWTRPNRMPPNWVRRVSERA